MRVGTSCLRFNPQRPRGGLSSRLRVSVALWRPRGLLRSRSSSAALLLGEGRGLHPAPSPPWRPARPGSRGPSGLASAERGQLQIARAQAIRPARRPRGGRVTAGERRRRLSAHLDAAAPRGFAGEGGRVGCLRARERDPE